MTRPSKWKSVTSCVWRFRAGSYVGQTFERPRKSTPKWPLPRHFRRQEARRCTRRLEPASYYRSATSNIGQRWRLGNRRKCCGSALRARWPVYAAANAGAARSGSTQHDAACWDRHILHTRLFTVSRPAGGQKRCAISTLPPRQPAKRRARCGSLRCCAARWTTLRITFDAAKNTHSRRPSRSSSRRARA